MIMVGFLANEASRLPQRQTQPKDILEQDPWYEEKTIAEELDSPIMSPRTGE